MAQWSLGGRVWPVVFLADDVTCLEVMQLVTLLGLGWGGLLGLHGFDGRAVVGWKSLGSCFFGL